jgi:hypothetical protein
MKLMTFRSPRRLLAFFTCAYVVAMAAPAYAVCHTDACKQAIAWKSGYTAIVLDDSITSENYFAVLDGVKANGGIVAIEAERVLLGWVPRPQAARVRSLPGVRGIYFDRIALPSGLVRNEQGRTALSFFNQVLSGEYEDQIEKGLTIQGSPLTGCVIPKPMAMPAGSSAMDAGVRSRVTIPGAKPEFWFNTPFQNPSMRGRVTVQYFMVDSDGTIDPNLYTWTWDDFNYAINQLYGAFTFWVNQAAARSITLSFSLFNMNPFSRYTRTYVPTPTHYEPITHHYYDDYLWVNDALTILGYGASPVTPTNVYTKNEAFNRDRKSVAPYGPFDASFSVYVVYNPPPAPSTFLGGFRAYTMVDGPFVMLMWNSAGWGPQNLGVVLSHETGHIFWACDEYYDAADHTGCSSCGNCWAGLNNPRPSVGNENCDNTGATGCDVRVDCIMKTNNYTLCPRTPAQIGW